MLKYSDDARWILADASFTYLGDCYHGPGLLTWDPETGFRLEAFAARPGPSSPEVVHFYQLRPPQRRDRTAIRMRIRVGVHALRGGLALAPATLRDRWDVFDGYLSCPLRRVCFMIPQPDSLRPSDRWFGSALINVGRSGVWPDEVVRTIELASEPWARSFESAGLAYETSTLRVRGQVDGDLLTAHWSMDRSAYRRRNAWDWPLALQDALSIELGCAVAMLQREVHTSPSQHIERLAPRQALSLWPFQPFEDGVVNRARLFHLTEFLFKDGHEAQICRKLFDQMVRAKRQARWDDAELILATALEGCLRALDAARSADRGWRLSASLARFREQFLSPAWRPACRRAESVFARLRHRNAHPDWAFDKRDRDADTARAESFRDLCFLSTAIHKYNHVKQL